MFENKIIRGIHTSRYIASWTKAGGRLQYMCKFKAWLRSLVIDGDHLTADEIQYIVNYAMNGKLELQELAKEFILSTLTKQKRI